MSSENSTDAGPPAVAAAAQPPALVRAAGDRRLLAAAGAVAVVPAVIGLAVFYSGGLSVAALFLAIGWASIVATSYFLYRAAVAFDPAPGAEPLAGEGALTEQRRLELEREKKLLLKAIKEIEFDHAMGKLDDDDAAEITQTYRARALEIIRLVDAERANDYEQIVEKELAKRLAKSGVKIEALPAPKAEEAAAAPEPAAAAEPVAAAEPNCPQCGVKNDADAVFCKKCGNKLGA
jgi:hypothetical protein